MSEQQSVKPEREQQNSSTPTSFWSELKDRKVTRVAMVYTIVGWMVIQIAETTFPSLLIPEWALSLVIMCIFLGFPVSLILAWAFELTPEGLKTNSAARAAELQADESESHASKRNSFSLVFAAAIPTLIFGTLALLFYLRPAENSSLDNASTHQEVEQTVEQSIAVLPLINMSAIGDNAFFAGGVHEDILTNLTRIAGLRVISRTSALRYINSEMSLRDIGRELGVRYLVEGSVRRIKNHVRVTVQLIDASSDTHLWANNYDRELIDVFATQSAVAREISNSIHLAIQPETVEALDDMPTRSVRAYDVYMKARSIARTEPESESSLIRQRELLEQAVAEDPNFVEAWGVLNETYDHSIRTLNQNGWFLPEGADRDAIYNDLRGQSQRALNKAVALDPDNIETLLARASDSVAEVSADFRAERKKIIDYAIENYPDNAMAWYVLGWWHNLEGDLEAAKPAFQKALNLDPMHAQMVEGSLIHFRVAGDQEMVTQLYDRLAQISPEKGKLKRLAKVSLGARLELMLEAFRQTANQSLVEDFAIEMASSSAESFEDELDKRYSWVTFWELENNMGALLEPQDDLSLGANPLSFHIAFYLSMNGTLMQAQQLAGQTDHARTIARRIIGVEKFQVAHTGNFAARNDAVTATAYATLGDQAHAQQLIDKLLSDRSESYNAYGLPGFSALAAVDIDRAVKLLLEEKSRHPTWLGTDVVATFHVSFRDIIVHPDMQAYYLKEAKWVDYLAERVPEYGEYLESPR